MFRDIKTEKCFVILFFYMRKVRKMLSQISPLKKEQNNKTFFSLLYEKSEKNAITNFPSFCKRI